jgi:hypothetical protein
VAAKMNTPTFGLSLIVSLSHAGIYECCYVRPRGGRVRPVRLISTIDFSRPHLPEVSSGWNGATDRLRCAPSVNWEE